MHLIKPKVQYLMYFKGLKPAENCSTDKGLLEEFKRTQICKYKDFIALKEREKVSDTIRRSVLLTLLVRGVLVIIVNGLWWCIKRKTQIVPK